MPICAASAASDLPNVVFPLQACAISAMPTLNVDNCVSGVARLRRGDLSASISSCVVSVFGIVMLALRADAARARCLCFRSIHMFLSVRLIRTCVVIASKLHELKMFACAAFRILAIVDKVPGLFVLRVSNILSAPLTHASLVWLPVAGVT